MAQSSSSISDSGSNYGGNLATDGKTWLVVIVLAVAVLFAAVIAKKGGK